MIKLVYQFNPTWRKDFGKYNENDFREHLDN